jgi:Ca2+-binding RTX toxin-like protein
MDRTRTLGAASALVAGALLVTTAVATAHPGPWFGPRGFDDVWIGTRGDDVYTAPSDSRDLILGLGGNDQLDAGNENDVVRAGKGDDAVNGGEGRDRVRGGVGGDRLAGGDDGDKVIGGPGDDGINGQQGHDLIHAGPGADFILAADGVRDLIRCGPGRDEVRADRLDRIARDCELVERVEVIPAS